MPGQLSSPIRSLGVLTGGGDVPGLNAAIKALVYRAESMDIRVTGLRNVLLAWRVPLGQDGGIKMGSQPPALAPLAFCGLGFLGLLVCAAPAAKRSAASD